jgi:HTH-type transcriptional regulator/antitoxin HigA
MIRRTGKMTTGLKTPSSYYIELITTFPPRPITNDAELRATQNRINSILDRKTITQDERDYLNVLGILVYDYEQKHEPIPELKGIKLLKALMVEDNIQQQNLVELFKNDSLVSDILNGNKELTASQIQTLAEFFHISSAAFLE